MTKNPDNPNNNTRRPRLWKLKSSTLATPSLTMRENCIRQSYTHCSRWAIRLLPRYKPWHSSILSLLAIWPVCPRLVAAKLCHFCCLLSTHSSKRRRASQGNRGSKGKYRNRGKKRDRGNRVSRENKRKKRNRVNKRNRGKKVEKVKHRKRTRSNLEDTP